ncbi:MAG TPA: hypothetical protein VK934_00350 [Fimbriimonas sp.]|nr:hypothetical protein [Fimbriimonas sp.]
MTGSLLLCVFCVVVGASLLKGYLADRTRNGGPFAAFWRGFIFICVASLFGAALLSFAHLGLALFLASVPAGLIVMLWLLTSGTRRQR